jgi:protein-S-isoprenylcysteine O-methyltransferase Ste14
MSDLFVEVSLEACWGIVLFVWIAGAVYNARRAPRQRIRDRSGAAVYVVAVAICAVVAGAGYELLHGLTLDAEWARILGLAILVTSSVFTLWARFALGTMWSVAPEVGGDHHLRTSGPYGVTRHPIYTGFLGMLLGTTLLAGVHEFIVILPVGLALFELKIRQEERLMLATFPDEYPDYRRRVPQIVPGLQVLRRRG